MLQLRRLTTLVSAAMLLAACGDQAVDDPTTAPLTGEIDPQSAPVTELDLMFQDAAEEFGVPVSLLKAVGFAETRWQMVQGHEEFEGMPAAFGIMALRGERLTRGAALAGVSVEEAKTDILSNLRAGAALLSEEANLLQINRSDLRAWSGAVAKVSGIENAEAQDAYVRKDVFGVMRDGVVVQNERGVIASIMPENDGKLEPVDPSISQVAGPDYASSIWRASPNYNSRPAGTTPSMVIIHTCEGSYSSCWNWLTNPDSSVSAHYVVNEGGGEISQLVKESNRAWHIGANYDCSLNNSVDCGKNGLSSNHFTIGIEHAGYASQASFPAGQIDASAKLVCDISKGHGIIRDKYHIVGHGKLQPYNRVDPGPNWPWTQYIDKIKAACNDAGSGSTGIIIDSNNNNNDQSQYYVETSANWTSSTNVAGYYGSGYFAASTEAISDGASFYFYLPSAATKTVAAWWTSASDRATTAPYVMFNAGGTNLGTANVNQQINGGKWNTLGTFNFSAGWNKVVLSRWTGAGSVVIADAVRVY